ncbi:uncharacterized protein Triagg1_2166 [Trichoderma aggressivum f. europaeum]|uniref:Quinoprotein amine dehydrogenase beta chain-like protein n=1 Tax=Trichoderma aggressivum f. europaeum TaxID=173218 RepID=A0AAE1IHM6_9HYPO|nr:hypothetical protein Triagg1_2166 [Trichoderma aggressivum f. europaeum]
MHSSFFFTFSALIASVATTAVINLTDESPFTTVQDNRLIYQFANGTTIENIAVRSNGSLLVTLSSTPELYQVDPFNPENPKLVHHFSGYLALVGITEVSPDVFTLIASNFSAATGESPSSWAVWQVAFQEEQTEISKVTDLPGAEFPNGMTTLETTPNTVLIADSAAGVVYRVNTQTGEFQVVLEDETFKAAPGSPQPIGVNGIRYLDNYVYYTNSFGPLFGRVPVNASGSAVGDFEVILAGIIGDDFTITPQAAYIAGNPTNVVTEVMLDGESKVIAGNINSSLVAGATSVQFGRTARDSNVLYVTTTGTVNATFTEGGKIVALDIE